jgi:pyruvate dehydrogenase (quinone)
MNAMSTACQRGARIWRETPVAGLLVDGLAEAGVERVNGVPSDSLNGITDSIRVREGISWIGVRHDEAAALSI